MPICLMRFGRLYFTGLLILAAIQLARGYFHSVFLFSCSVKFKSIGARDPHCFLRSKNEAYLFMKTFSCTNLRSFFCLQHWCIFFPMCFLLEPSKLFTPSLTFMLQVLAGDLDTPSSTLVGCIVNTSNHLISYLSWLLLFPWYIRHN